MKFNFMNLDEITRKYMIEEVEIARQTKNIYYSKRFNDKGFSCWCDLLQEAVSKYDEKWLASEIEAQGLFKAAEGYNTPSGNLGIKPIPQNAAETLADGQFNRFYILGICRKAIDEGVPNVLVYRAKNREEHRVDSDTLIGTSIQPQEIILSLRNCESSLRNVLLKPNSGLSVKI